MKLRDFSDAQLLNATKVLVREERERLTVILRHLAEIERRRLFAAEGCSSLFQYAVKVLGYPEDQAYRRVAAVRMLKELPEIEEQLRDGILNLTQLGAVKRLFREKKFSREQKLDFLGKISRRSTRETIIEIARLLPVSAREDRVKQLNKGEVELRFTADASVVPKIEVLKGRLAHTEPFLSLGRLFEFLCDQQLNRFNKTAAPRDGLRQSRATVLQNLRAQGICENCGSVYALERDHITPKAQGGSDEPHNFRLLCRSCNQRAAIEAFGLEKMDPHLN